MSRASSEGNPTANRTYNQFQGTLQKGVVTLYAKLTFDGAGAATVVTSEVINATSSPVTINPSNGFVGETITPVGATYKVKLQDPYVRLLLASAVEVSAAPANDKIAVLVDSVNDQNDPHVVVAFGSPPPASTTILMALDLANSTAL